jgi:hypothetical protein
LIVEHFTEPGAEVLVAVDDTLLHRLGRKIARSTARTGITTRPPTATSTPAHGGTTGS